MSVLSPRIILYLDARRGFDRGLLSGIARYSSLHGNWTFYRQAPTYLGTRKGAGVPELRAWRPDGMICPVRQMSTLSELDVPMVAFDSASHQEPYPMVVTDDERVGQLAAEHLLNQGHRHFAFCGYEVLEWSRRRSDAFSAHAKDSGFEVKVYPGAGKRLSQAQEEKRLSNWLRSLPKPTGIFCCNDDRATTVLELCGSLGFDLPDDVSIIGADDDAMICDLANPPLTSVRIASGQGGYEMAALLHDFIRGKQKMQQQRIVCPATGITVRRSTDRLMIENPHVRRALRFIRAHANSPILVQDVVEASGLSHRALNDQFHRELGTSIRKHLTQARVDTISRLLIDTDMQVQEIAMMVGYDDDRHFSRYFKRVTGLSPKEYRRKMAAP